MSFSCWSSGRAACALLRKAPLHPAAAALAFLALTASAQAPTDGSIAGRVVDAIQAPVPAVRITARNLETGLAQSTLTGSHGDYVLTHLPAGPYALTVDLPSASIPLPRPTNLAPGELLELDAHLPPSPTVLIPTPAPTAPTTQPTPTPPPEDTEESDAATLPTSPDADSDTAAPTLSTLSFDTPTLDGLAASNAFTNSRIGAGVLTNASASDIVSDRASGPGIGWRSVEDGDRRSGSVYAFAPAAVRELRTGGLGSITSIGTALYGHSIGGVVPSAGDLHSVTRSGGAKLHGMAFYTLREAAWAATNPFSIATAYTNGAVTSTFVKPPDTRQQFGGRISGPLTRSTHPRLFYLYAFDAQRRGFPAIASPGDPNFYLLTPTQTDLLANRGVTSTQTAAALTYITSLTGTVPRRADQTVNFGRIDWQPTSAARLIAETNVAQWSSPAGSRTEPVVSRGMASIGSSFGNFQSGLARWVQFLTPRISNELRLQYSHELQYETPQTPLPQEPAIGPNNLPPQVSIGPDGILFGTPASLGQRAYPDERRLELADLLELTHGRHTLQLGLDVSILRDATDSLTNTEGAFTYDSGVTSGHAGGLADFIADYTYGVNAYPNGACPSLFGSPHYFCFHAFTQNFGQQSIHFPTQDWATFAQYNLRVSSRLSVSLGARYEYQLLPLPQQPNAALDATFSSFGATNIYPEDRNNLGPRIGLAWQPLGLGRGLISAGWGLYFGHLPGATIRAAMLDTALPSSSLRVRILPTTITSCPQTPTVGFGYPCSFLTQPPSGVADTTSATVFSRGFRLPAVQQGTFAIERPITRHTTLAARYVLNLDRQLPNSTDINIAPSTATRTFILQGGPSNNETFVIPLYTTRVDPGFGPVTAIVSNVNATYNGLTLEGRHTSRSLTLHAAWTWSKAIDFGQSPSATPRLNGQFDPFNIRYDKGLSALNFPHRIAASATWSPHPGFGGADASTRTLRTLASNWSLATSLTEHSGRPYSYEIFGGTRLSGGRESINGAGGSTVIPTVGRNTLRLSDTVNLDLRLTRSFLLTETVHLRASADAFNLTNHTNLTGVQQRAYLVGTPAVTGQPTPLTFQDASAITSEGLNIQPFSTPTASSSPETRERHLQLSLQLTF